LYVKDLRAKQTVLIFRALFTAAIPPYFEANCKMLSIHGPAMNRHSAKRAASGCPSILGGRPRPVAEYRGFAPELDR
jgi:hypothetical protein